jgi:hypothetical protein
VTGPVGVVLDTPALLAYSTGAETVGEQIATMADLERRVLVPALCLATAYQHVTSEGWPVLDVLVDLPQVHVTPVEADMCAVLGGWARTLGLDLAHAAMEAAQHAVVPIVTNRGRVVTRILAQDWPIIDL